MAKSIFTNDMHSCFFTGSSSCVENHHIFYGRGKRVLSEKYGLKIPVDHYLHNEPPYGIHYNKAFDLALKQFAQRKFEQTHTRVEFMLLFGRNYLYTEDDGYEINLRELGIPICDMIA